MARFHINPETGDPGRCDAKKGKCPFGGDANHYSSMDKAREAYELSMAAEAVPAVKRSKFRSSVDAITNAQARREEKGFVEIAERQRWRTLKEFGGKERLKQTHGKLKELSESLPQTGTMFERADALRETYRFHYEQVSDNMPSGAHPEHVSREAYLNVVAPAVNQTVGAMERFLNEKDWNLVEFASNLDTNRRDFVRLLPLDMNKREDRKKAEEILRRSEIYFDPSDDRGVTQLSEAIELGRKTAISYGSRLKYELTHML